MDVLKPDVRPRMKRYLPFLIIVIVAASAVAAGTVIYRAKVAELAAINAAAPQIDPNAIAAQGAKPPHIRGSAKARVTLEEFGDFQCPPCEMLAPVLTRIEHDYADKVRVVFRQFPLAMHQHAMRAAQAAEAAGLQGRFWEMYDTLYRKRTAWATKNATEVEALFLEYAGAIGLDVERFKQDLETDAVKTRVRADQARGASLGVNSTPTIFINGEKLPFQMLAEPALRAAIDNVLAGKPLGTPAPTPQPTRAAPPATTLSPPPADAPLPPASTPPPADALPPANTPPP